MMAVTPSRVPRRAAASLPLMPLSLQHHFDRRIVSRPEVARRLVLAVPTHLQDPVCRNGLQVVGITRVVVIQPNPNRSEEHTAELQSRPHLAFRLLPGEKEICGTE